MERAGLLCSAWTDIRRCTRYPNTSSYGINDQPYTRLDLHVSVAI